MKTLYISDLDGTLLQPDVELSKKTITILNELIGQGMLFSVATARSIASLKTILKDVAITMPIVMMNGVCIYDLKKDEYLKIETFSEQNIRFLLSVVKSHKLKGFAYAIKDGVMSTYYEDLSTQPLRNFYQERVDKYQKYFTRIDDFSSLAALPLIYFSLLDHKENLEEIYDIMNNVPDINCVLYKDNYSLDWWYLEIFSKNASKYHAVQFLRTYLELDSIVCFGDNHNDIPLFEASDRKFAVANAVAELKGKADEVIGSNDQDGVAVWLKQNVKII